MTRDLSALAGVDGVGNGPDNNDGKRGSLRSSRRWRLLMKPAF